jgi:hypothetical protein
MKFAVLTVAVFLVGYGLLCLGVAFYPIFTRHPMSQREEENQNRAFGLGAMCLGLGTIIYLLSRLVFLNVQSLQV